MKIKRILPARDFKVIILMLSIAIVSLVSCISVASAAGFVSVNGTEFYLNGKPFYFGGANNYYLRYGDPNCIAYDKNGGCTREVLDDAAKMGLRVIRTWGFTDGYYYWGSLQPSMGVYDDKVFQQMDLLIKEADERDIKLMIPLVNN